MRRGRFEQADEGTLFLDEIGDMPMDLQTRLLRVLSDGHFYRVGGHAPIKANVRVIAATHQDLEERVKQGLFREDLFHRLNVIRLRIPALRERKEDIALLARHFLAQSARELGVDAKKFSDASMEFLQTLPFKGNVRQLENLCHWVTVMAPSQVVEVKDLPEDLRGAPVSNAVENSTSDSAPTNGSWTAQLHEITRTKLRGNEAQVMDQLAAQFERVVIQAALAQTGGRRVEAAQRLGIGRNTITRKIAELGIDSPAEE
jgi:two-component system nitrogen regulation response regulator GlnG